MSRPIWLKPPLFLRSQPHPLALRVSAPGRPRLALPADSLELTVVAIILALAAMLAYGISEVFAPVSSLKAISLDPLRLPEYAVRTVLRMLAAMGASLVFTLVYGTLAAKSRRAEIVLVPLLDILQSVPVLGYLSFTVAFFVGLAPHWVLGLELASIFAIFTSQAWNMAFSFFQALRTLPLDLDEASRAFGFSAWQRFWRLEFPFAVPGLVWNMMMSMSGGWFFVVASEAITADQRQIALPGIGSYVALAIAQRNLAAIGFAIAAMTIVIVIYDQLLFRPLVVWADKFRVEQTASQSTPHSWFLELLRRSHMAQAAAVPVTFCLRSLFRARIFNIIPASRPVTIRSRASRAIDVLWYIVVAAAALWLAAIIVRFVAQGAGWSDVLTVLRLGRLYAAARHRPDRSGLADLGAGWRGDRPAAAACREGSAAGAISRRLPGQSALPALRHSDRQVQAQYRYLAYAADDPRNAMVHPVQCHRRYDSLADRPSGGRLRTFVFTAGNGGGS